MIVIVKILKKLHYPSLGCNISAVWRLIRTNDWHQHCQPKNMTIFTIMIVGKTAPQSSVQWWGSSIFFSALSQPMFYTPSGVIGNAHPCLMMSRWWWRFSTDLSTFVIKYFLDHKWGYRKWVVIMMNFDPVHSVVYTVICRYLCDPLLGSLCSDLSYD